LRDRCERLEEEREQRRGEVGKLLNSLA
jgi:hypothetical protein